MPWVEVFTVFVVCHLAGDYLLQTDWQATNKRGGLGRDRQSRRALTSHVATYTLAFSPAIAWLWSDLGVGALAVAALIAGPHLVQDDGRLLGLYMSAVKRTQPRPGLLTAAVDQSFHLVALFLTALLAGS